MRRIEQFVLVIQIIRVERKEENLILVNLEKGEGRNKDFISQNKKRRVNNKMLREIDPGHHSQSWYFTRRALGGGFNIY